MSKYEDGELIPLRFNGHPGYEFIKGHVSMEEAQQALQADYESGDRTKVSGVEHTYAFWGVSQDEYGEPCQCFFERDEPGRGRFKVTKAYCLEAVDGFEVPH